MKRILLSAILVLAMALAAVQAEAVSDKRTIISETQLDDDPTSVTSSTYTIDHLRKVTFFVDYDETEIGATVSIAITLDISYDGTNWIDASFYDFAGGTNMQTSETMSSDGWYVCWMNPYLTPVYVRMVITGTNTDDDDLAVVTAYMVGAQ